MKRPILQMEVIEAPPGPHLSMADQYEPLPHAPRERVVVPYVPSPVFDIVRANLTMQNIEAEYREMAGEDDYSDLFRELWSDGLPFVIVEHDVLPWPGAVTDLAECPAPWCGYVYQINERLESWLGCTKFDPRQLGACPLPDYLHGWQFDVPVQSELMFRGFPKHIHLPAVVHLHEYEVH